MSAGIENVNDQDAYYLITIDLTLDGLEHVDSVVGETFRYIRQIDESAATELWRFREMQRINELFLLYDDPIALSQAVIAVAEAASLYPIEDILISDYLFTEFRKSLIKAVLAQMVPQNALIILAHNEVEGDLLEPWYNVSYSIKKIPDKKIVEWNNPRKNDQIFKLPDENPYISELSKISNPEQKQFTNIKEKPKLISEKAGIKFWCMNAHPFTESPKIDFEILLINGNLSKSARNSVMISIFTRLATNELGREMTPAITAGNSIALGVSWRGLHLSAMSFETSVLQEITRKAAKVIRGLKIDQKQFEIIKQEMTQMLESVVLSEPYFKIQNDMSVLLVEDSWSNEDLIEQLDSIQVGDLQTFVDKVLFSNDTAVEALVLGRYNCRASNEFETVLRQGFGKLSIYA